MLFSFDVFIVLQRFQELEEKHLQQMRDFVEAYAKSWENQHAMLGQVLRSIFLLCILTINNFNRT